MRPFESKRTPTGNDKSSSYSTKAKQVYLKYARFAKALNEFFKTASLSGCIFMTASVACRGKGGVG